MLVKQNKKGLIMGIDAKMLIKNRGKVKSSDEILALAIQLYNCFSDIIWIPKDNSHCLNEVSEYHQDGDTIIAESGEQLIDVSLSCRYYGHGYERGPIHQIVGLAMMLEYKWPNVELYYGGDSSGVCAEPFTESVRRKYLEHFYTHGHRPYAQAFHSLYPADVECPRCKIPMFSSGGGNNSSFMNCYGCHNRCVVRRDKEPVWLGRCDDFFKVNADLK